MGIFERLSLWWRGEKARPMEEPKRCLQCGEPLRFEAGWFPRGLAMVDCPCGFSVVVDMTGEMDQHFDESARIVEMLETLNMEEERKANGRSEGAA